MVSAMFTVFIKNFYPRPPRGERPAPPCHDGRRRLFLSTPSARRATLERPAAARLTGISIHALREEGDCPTDDTAVAVDYFYPRPPRGGRLPFLLRDVVRRFISIHALREEGDVHGLLAVCRPVYFYPRPPRGGRRCPADHVAVKLQISIHALREEGDAVTGSQLFLIVSFLSTPSARRATQNRKAPTPLYFFSTPPLRVVGDPADHAEDQKEEISIHALREEGDCKNGEKYLRFCFIIKRSAQIWKSFSGNIRKKSRDLHRTA